MKNVYSLKIILGIFLTLIILSRCTTSTIENQTQNNEAKDNETNNGTYNIFSDDCSKDSEFYCETNNDCSCRTNIETKECFFGNKYKNTKEQCSDFCFGIA